MENKENSGIYLNDCSGDRYTENCNHDEMEALKDSKLTTLRDVQIYTANSSEITSCMREMYDKDNVRQSDRVNREIQNIRNYVDGGSLFDDMKLFRGTSDEHFLWNFRQDGELIHTSWRDWNSRNGEELTEKYRNEIIIPVQFLSTSIEYTEACKFLKGPTLCMLEIFAPKGTNGRCIEKISTHPEEREVLLNVGIKLQIKKIEVKANGMKVITLNAVK